MRILFAVAFVGLAACASGTPMNESREAATPIPADKARIVVYRNSVYGTAVQPYVSVDGRQVGTCQPKGAFSVDVQPGNRVVSAATEVKKEALVVAQKGQTSYVRCSVGFGVLVGRPTLEVVPASTGQAESASLAFTGKF